MIFLSLLVSIGIFVWSKPKRNLLLDPMTMFFVGLLYYGYFIPIAMTLSNSYFLPFLSGALFISRYDIGIISLLLPMGYLGFVLGYRLFIPAAFIDTLFARADAAQDELHKDITGIVLGVTLVTLLGVCVAFFSSDLSMVLAGYEQKIQARYEGSTFSLVYNTMLATAAATLAWRVLRSKRPIRVGVVSAVALFVWSLMTFSKEPMVYGALVLFATAARSSPRRQGAVFLWALIGGVFLLVFFIPAFSIYRSSGELTLVGLDDLSLPFLFSDAGGPFSALVLSIRNEASVELAPFFQSFVLWIPRGIWESRPLDAAEDFARAVMPDWQPGYGLGFSPFAEAKLRFGIVLSPILLFLSGLFIAGFQKWVVRLVVPSVAPALLLVVQGYILFTLHRGSFSGIFTSMFQFWFPFLALTLLLNALLRPKPAV